jgi:hypothetical protein
MFALKRRMLLFHHTDALQLQLFLGGLVGSMSMGTTLLQQLLTYLILYEQRISPMLS